MFPHALLRLPLLLLGLLAAASTLTGCANFSAASTQVSTLGGILTPYRMDIQQGNVVTREQVAALQPGMSRLMVRNILGTPLLASALHENRWDYVFTLVRQGHEPQQRRVTVFFDGDRLARVQADELPSEREFVAALQALERPGRIPPLQASEAELSAFRERHPLAPTAPVAPLAPAGPFPPLEAPR